MIVNDIIYLEPIWDNIDKDCIDFIKKMLTYNMNERISATDALQEPWIKKYTTSHITEKDLLLSLNNLKNFRIQTLFQAAVLSYITSQQMYKADEARIRDIFDSFDKDGNGHLTKKELIDMLTYIHGDFKKMHKEADNIMRNLDLNNSGTIEYNGIYIWNLECLVANLQLTSLLSEANLKLAFEFYDIVKFNNK